MHTPECTCKGIIIIHLSLSFPAWSIYPYENLLFYKSLYSKGSGVKGKDGLRSAVF